LRDSAGFAPDFAGLAAVPGTGPGITSTVTGYLIIVKVDEMIR
jgi:hypothetical protein